MAEKPESSQASGDWGNVYYHVPSQLLENAPADDEYPLEDHAPAYINHPEVLKDGEKSIVLGTAWKIWHKTHCLVIRYGCIKLEQLEDLLQLHFGIEIRHEAYGFETCYKLWKSFNDFFSNIWKYPRAAVMKEQYSPMPGEYTPICTYLVLNDPIALYNFDKVFNKCVPKRVLYNTREVVVDQPEPEPEIPLEEPIEFAKQGDEPEFTRDYIRTGSLAKCVTVCVKSFHEFYVQAIDDLGSFLPFEEEMQKEFKSPKFAEKNLVNIDEIMKGLYVAVYVNRHDDDQVYYKWFRARVLKACENDRVLVHLIDYGNLALVDHANMRRLPKSYLTSQKVIGICCRFEHEFPPEDQLKVKQHFLPLGLLLHDYLWDMKAQELVRFHCRWTNPKTGRRMWKIASTLVHPFLQEYFTPNETVPQIIFDKYFKEKVTPRELLRSEKDLDWGDDVEWEYCKKTLQFIRKVQKPVLEFWGAEIRRLFQQNENTEQPDPGIYADILNKRKVEVTSEFMEKFHWDMLEWNEQKIKIEPGFKDEDDEVPGEENDYDLLNPEKRDIIIQMLQEYADLPKMDWREKWRLRKSKPTYCF